MKILMMENEDILLKNDDLCGRGGAVIQVRQGKRKMMILHLKTMDFYCTMISFY